MKRKHHKATSNPQDACPPLPKIEQRLYVISNGVYVQCAGTGPKPKQLQEYMAAHGGEPPPYFPLPNGPTRFSFKQFFLGEAFKKPLEVYWNGKGPLPSEVLDYIRQNGTLPPHAEG